MMERKKGKRIGCLAVIAAVLLVPLLFSCAAGMLTRMNKAQSAREEAELAPPFTTAETAATETTETTATEEVTETTSEPAAEPSSETVTEAPTEPETEPPTEAETTALDMSLVTPEVKAALDSYEALVDEYVALMQQYNANPTDMELMTRYLGLVNKVYEMEAKFDAWDQTEMTPADNAYYLEVLLRCEQKMLGTVAGMQ